MKNNRTLPIIGILLLAFSMLWQGCLSDEISTDPSFSVEFSQDTVRFDTVFTTIGSATRSFKILNKNDQDIAIASIRLDDGDETMFRLNVDGLPGQIFSDIRVPANDSIWVFAEVTVDPDQPLSISPYVIEDKVLFTVNGNEEFVQLEAFGQNANYITSDSNIGSNALLTCDFGSINWDDPKPYIIYGVLVIQDCTINIPAGTHIHVHGGIVPDMGTFRNDGFIVVDQGGKIEANGTLNNPIIFQGDRLEEEFQDVSGQWGGIIFTPFSRASTLNFVEIKNSVVGFRADSSSIVNMINSKIYNTAGNGIQARFATVTVENSLIHSNNVSCIQATFGGQYNFNHCTMANYLNSDEAVVLTNSSCLSRNSLGECTLIGILDLNATFTNCVIAGNDSNEIILVDEDGFDGDNFNYQFNHSTIQIDDDLLDAEQFTDLLTVHCDNCFQITRNDTLFRDEDRIDFHPDTLSTLINKGIFNPALSLDLDGVFREAGNTDIGCYEFVPE